MKNFILLCLSLLLLACSKVSYENYQQLEMGMDYQEVVNLLGEPDACTDTLGNKQCLWGEEKSSHIRVNSLAGKVIFYQQSGLK